MKISALDFPKSFGNTSKDFYRLGTNSKNPVITEGKIWLTIKSKALLSKPVKKYKDLEFIGNGWEWSAFKKDSNTVIKVPAGIFEEVNNPAYLKNTADSYKKITKYFPKKFIAESIFYSKDGLNIMEQEYVDDPGRFIISFSESDEELLKNIREFLVCVLQMLNEEDWMPDLDIKRQRKGYQFRALIDKNKIPKITDFTYYYDPFRLFPKRTIDVIEFKRKRILSFKSFIEKRIS